MKKSFPPLKKIRERGQKRLGIWAALVILLFLGLTGFPRLRAEALNLSGDVLKLGQKVKNFSDFFQEFLARKIFLVEELETLKSSALEKNLRNAALEARISELEKIEKLLGDEPNPGKLALILSSNPAAPYDSFVVNLGEENGVKIGDKAVAYGSLALGTVEKTSRRDSVIKLFSYPGLATDGFLQSKSLNVVLKGRGASNLEFSVPKNLDIKIGERVLSNSAPAYLIGQVEYVGERPSEPLAEVIVRPPVNLLELRYLELKP